jgi:uncharacterized repeat protein (TIGR01451 family)
VTNLGPDDASNVTVNDPIEPALLSVVSVPAGCVLDGGTLTCLLGALAVGQTKTITFTVLVAAGVPTGAQITNCATAGSVSVELRDEPNPACTQSVVLPPARSRLVITKTAPRTVRPGGTVTYQVTLSNSGPDTAQDVVVKDPVQDPSLITITSLPPECSLAGVTVTCELATLAAGETRHFTAAIRVRDTVPDGTVLGNCIAVYSSTQDTDPELDDIQSCVNTVVRRQADVTVVKKGPATAYAGGTLSYTITAANHGHDTAADVIISDPVDLSLVAVKSLPGDCSLAHGTITCRAGTLPVGQEKTFRITVSVLPDVKEGTTIRNCATASSSTATLEAPGRESCTVATAGRPFVPVTG